MWENEVDDSVSTLLDSVNDDSNLLFDFTVAKKDTQEEDVVTRKGFTVLWFITIPFPPQ